MKKYINRNYFWASLFVKQLETLGIKDVCISPGSRNTPLTLAFAGNKKIKKYIHVDERSSGFFALGLAKQRNKPVVIVTTSGTAVAELYPAVIEAYQQRVPLIVCSADRPSYLKNTGANQTINQKNIFENHIRKFIDVGLPGISKTKLQRFCKKTVDAIEYISNFDKGPLQINFPFEKPFEPDTFTGDINFKISDFIIKEKPVRKISVNNFGKIIAAIKKYDKTIILLGWNSYESNFYKTLSHISRLTGIPVFADGTTGFRFFKKENQFIIANHTAFLKNKNVWKKYKPGLILQFGNAPTSQIMLRFLNGINSERIIINEFGDNKSSSKKKYEIVKAEPVLLLNEIVKHKNEININKEWQKKIIRSDKLCEEIKNEIINKPTVKLEHAIVNRILNIIPDKSNLFISNSMPVRDFDFFASKNSKQIKIFTNRGASGIDGIISTASGIAAQSKSKTFLVIGDLAFYHNLTALSTLNELKIPLTIILVNNNGGGLFNMLPVANYKKFFDEYFVVSQNLNFRSIVKAFNGNYYNPQNIKAFELNLKNAISNKLYSVIEIKTDAKKSLEQRKKYWWKVKQEILNNDY